MASGDPVAGNTYLHTGDVLSRGSGGEYVPRLCTIFSYFRTSFSFSLWLGEWDHFTRRTETFQKISNMYSYFLYILHCMDFRWWRGGGENGDCSRSLVRTVSTGCETPQCAASWMLLLYARDSSRWLLTPGPHFLSRGAQTFWHRARAYTVDRVSLKSFSIPAGSRVSNQENLFLGTLPKSIVIAMVDNDAFTGSYTKNPFTFKYYDLEFLAVYVDGQQYPSKPLQPNFEAGSAVREYYQLVMTTGRHLKDQPLCIGRNDFLNGYTLYAFNLTPDEECGQHISLIKSGNIRVEARFRKPLPNTINLIVYAVFDSIIELSNRRQVLIDYYWDEHTAAHRHHG